MNSPYVYEFKDYVRWEVSSLSLGYRSSWARKPVWRPIPTGIFPYPHNLTTSFWLSISLSLISGICVRPPWTEVLEYSNKYLIPYLLPLYSCLIKRLWRRNLYRKNLGATTDQFQSLWKMTQFTSLPVHHFSTQCSVHFSWWWDMTELVMALMPFKMHFWNNCSEESWRVNSFSLICNPPWIMTYKIQELKLREARFTAAFFTQ